MSQNFKMGVLIPFRDILEKFSPKAPKTSLTNPLSFMDFASLVSTSRDRHIIVNSCFFSDGDLNKSRIEMAFTIQTIPNFLHERLHSPSQICVK